nr:immunoglobulin light chain junction region [Homo sapiens]
VAVYYCQQYY